MTQLTIEDDDSDLEQIIDCLFLEIPVKYSRWFYRKLKLAAPGYTLACMRDQSTDWKDCLFMLKATRYGLLFDITNKQGCFDYNPQMEEGMNRRKLQIDYGDPKMMDLVFELIEKIDIFETYVMDR